LAYYLKIIPVLAYERFAGFGLTAARPVAVIPILAPLAIFVLLQALLVPNREAHSEGGWIKNRPERQWDGDLSCLSIYPK
jgi:hypothetical protein